MQLPPCQGQGPARLLTISFASAGPEAGTSTPFRVRVRGPDRGPGHLLTISSERRRISLSRYLAGARVTRPHV